jgi:hypothetical protein
MYGRLRIRDVDWIAFLMLLLGHCDDLVNTQIWNLLTHHTGLWSYMLLIILLFRRLLSIHLFFLTWRLCVSVSNIGLLSLVSLVNLINWTLASRVLAIRLISWFTWCFLLLPSLTDLELNKSCSLVIMLENLLMRILLSRVSSALQIILAIF